MPKLKPPSRPAFKVGDVVTVGNSSAPWRIVGFLLSSPESYQLVNSAGEEMETFGPLFRYHGNQQP